MRGKTIMAVDFISLLAPPICFHYYIFIPSNWIRAKKKNNSKVIAQTLVTDCIFKWATAREATDYIFRTTEKHSKYLLLSIK